MKTSRSKRHARKEENAARFSELEKDNAARMAQMEKNSQLSRQEREQPQRILSGLGDWQDDRGLRRRGSSGSLVEEDSRRSQEVERPPPGYEDMRK